jgi:hypothetical protein
LKKITSTAIAYVLALRDFANFVKSWGPFFDTPPMKDLDLFPHECWDFIKASGYTLTPMAHHILVYSHHYANKIGIPIHLSIAKCEIG